MLAFLHHRKHGIFSYIIGKHEDWLISLSIMLLSWEVIFTETSLWKFWFFFFPCHTALECDTGTEQRWNTVFK